MKDFELLNKAFSHLEEQRKEFLMKLSSHFINISESNEIFSNIINIHMNRFIAQAQSELSRLAVGDLALNQFTTNINLIENAVFYHFTNEVSRTFPNAQTAREHGKEGGPEESKPSTEETTAYMEIEIPTAPIPENNENFNGYDSINKGEIPSAPAPEKSDDTFNSNEVVDMYLSVKSYT